MNIKFSKSRMISLSVFVLFLIGLLAISGSVQARMHMGGSQDRQSLEQGETIDGPGFFSGDFVQIDGDVNGTTFAAGDNIEINGDIDGALFVAGDTVQINGEVTGNIYGAGKLIQMRGQNDGEIFFAGETINVEQDAAIGRDAFIAGMTITLQADIPRHFFGAGQTLSLNGTIGGNASVDGENLRLGDSASIEGDFEYRSPNEADMSPGATVAGETDYTQRESVNARRGMTWNITQRQRWIFRALLALWSLLSALVVWILIKLLSPHFWVDNARTISNELLKVSGLGLLALIGTPFLVILLMITVIGIPMGIILAMLYGIALFISRIIVALYIAASLFRLFGKPDFSNEFVLVLVGLFLLELLGLIPYVGWIFGLIAVILGLGALVLSGRQPTPVKEVLY